MANTRTSLDAALKYVQEKNLLDIKPNSSIIYDMAPMKEGDSLGRKYLAPVTLSFELGFTFGDGGAFTYNDDIAGVYDEVEIDPTPLVLKSRLSMEAADRIAKSEKAVISSTALRAGQMKASLMKMAEIEMLHGRVGVGILASDPAKPTSTTATLIFTAASWCPGVWGGMEGALLDAYAGASQVNTNAAIVLVSVDPENRTLNVSGNSTDLTNLTTSDVIYFKGAYANGQYGIKYQLDTSGSVFGIDNSVYSLRKAQEHSVSGALTFAQVLKGRAKAVSRAGLDEDCVLIVSPVTFEGLNSDQAAARVFDSSYNASKSESGSKRIVYHAQGGSIEVVAHPFMKEGEAFMIPKKGLKRVGATDVTFRGMSGEAAWEPLESVGAYQLTCRYSFQVLVVEPGKCVLFSGIVNS